ncbi:hypothetical protein ACNFIA_28885 [Pseudomonas sp. NY15437]|uniref:hypothetical protein n=1 Tax=Pseudomonas sp. NY15437 TaxID=3400360 RepID=UPI003A888FFB
MNYFLDKDVDPRDIDFQDGSAYGKVDDIEVLDEQNGLLIISYNAILKEDLHNCGIQRKKSYRLADPLSSFSVSPYEKAVIFRVEIETTVKKEGFKSIEELEVSYENNWFNIYILEYGVGAGDAKLYTNLFNPPTDAKLKITKVKPSHRRKLNDEFSLAAADKISTLELEQELASRVLSADYLAIYDVGQGNSNALISSTNETCPVVYFDMGCGIGAHASTVPAGLDFCTCNNPLVILSHWDQDHWAGALRIKSKAFSLTWVVPRQQLDAVHKSFAHEIISAGGRLLVLDMPKDSAGSSRLPNSQLLKFTLGIGSSRNNSGIVLAIENNDPQFPSSWLLTGDCAYSHIPKSLQYPPPVAVVAPHHGGVTKLHNIAPSPAIHNDYNRLIYSYGPDNKFRTTQHPTSSSVRIHDLAGWDMGIWNTAPGSSSKTGNVRATSKHSPSPFERGGVLVGWESLPALPMVCPLGAPISKH